MIPDLININSAPWSVLPPGIHQAGLDEVEARFAINSWRRKLFDGLVLSAISLRNAGCSTIYLDGSFVTAKPRPSDFDACWDPFGVDQAKLDPVFTDFSNGRAMQKKKFKGEWFPSSLPNQGTTGTFLEFFQVERVTGSEKGILRIHTALDPALNRSTS